MRRRGSWRRWPVATPRWTSRAAMPRAGVDARAFLRSDWFAGVEGRFDLIVSNPPYIAAADMPGLAPEVRFRSRHRIDPGGDGLAAYRAIAAGRGAHLCPGGRLLVEIGHDAGGRRRGAFPAAGLAEVAVHPDINGKDRVVAGCRASGRRNGNVTGKNPQKYAVLRVSALFRRIPACLDRRQAGWLTPPRADFVRYRGPVNGWGPACSRPGAIWAPPLQHPGQLDQRHT
jgi:hypothetical protein